MAPVFPPMTEEQRTEQFRQLVATHMQKQTKALDTIQTLLILWSVLTVLGVVFLIVAGIAASNSGY